jgi:hypothetical protein
MLLWVLSYLAWATVELAGLRLCRSIFIVFNKVTGLGWSAWPHIVLSRCVAAYVSNYSSIGQISVLYAECYMIHLDSYVPVVPLHAACEGLVSVAYPVR